jgi:hypothetical protein
MIELKNAELVLRQQSLTHSNGQLNVVGTGTSIKNGGVKLLSWVQTLMNSDKLDKIFPPVDFYRTMYSYKAQMVKIDPPHPFLSPFNV